MVVRPDHRNILIMNCLPDGRRNARRECKSFPQKIEVNVRHLFTSK